jgi:hypothetical protein
MKTIFGVLATIDERNSRMLPNYFVNREDAATYAKNKGFYCDGEVIPLTVYDSLEELHKIEAEKKIEALRTSMPADEFERLVAAIKAGEIK